MRGFVKGLTNTYAVLNAVRTVVWAEGNCEGMPVRHDSRPLSNRLRPECPVRTAAGRSE